MAYSKTAFHVSSLYSNQEIYKSLCVGNTGGVRASITPGGQVKRLALFTAFPTQRQILENPYLDRLEGNVLVFTGAGKAGDQNVSGVNARLIQQADDCFPIYAFTQISSRRDTSVGVNRWKFLGLLEYLRCYRDQQVDSFGNLRSVWIFEFQVHTNPQIVVVEHECDIMADLIRTSRSDQILADRLVVGDHSTSKISPRPDITTLEPIRRTLLSCHPRQFEIIIHDLLIKSGFTGVEVTKYSQDGGIDINARPERHSWPLRQLQIQIQAKRWLHTVGRREIAELRGSLSPHASGCVVTTSHFSKAALLEAKIAGKMPITTIDGYDLAEIITDLKFKLNPIVEKDAE